jgi:hypothetical protein
VEGDLKLKSIFYFMTNRCTSIDEFRYSKIKWKFYWIFILFDKAFKCGEVANIFGYIGTNAERLYV